MRSCENNGLIATANLDSFLANLGGLNLCWKYVWQNWRKQGDEQKRKGRSIIVDDVPSIERTRNSIAMVARSIATKTALAFRVFHSITFSTWLFPAGVITHNLTESSHLSSLLQFLAFTEIPVKGSRRGIYQLFDIGHL